MLLKPEACKGCPLYGDGKGFVPDAVPPEPWLAVVGQNPGADEERGMRVTSTARDAFEPCPPQPLIGRTGYEWRTRYLPLTGVPEERVAKHNVLRCRWQRDGRRTNDMPSGDLLHRAVEHCTAAHFRPASSDDLTLYVAIGAHALRLLAPHTPGTITEWRGRLLPDYFHGVPILPTLHIADLFRDPRMTLPTQHDWSRVAAFRQGTWPKPFPRFMVVHGLSGLEFADWIHEAQSAKAEGMAVDTEYDPTDYRLRLVGLAYRDAGGAIRGLSVTSPHGDIGNWLWDCPVPLVFHNAAADFHALEYGADLVPGTLAEAVQFQDTMLAHHALWSALPHSLDFLGSIYSDYPRRKHLLGTDIVHYNQGDVVDTLCSWERLQAELKKDPGAAATYASLLPLVPIVMRRKARGIRVDQERVATAMEERTKTLQEAEALAEAATGRPINLGSPLQIGDVLYGERGYRAIYHHKTKQRTVNAEAIAALRSQVRPVPDLEAEARDGLTLAAVLRRVGEGADPLLEARALYATAQQELSHYLVPCEGKDRIYPDISLHAQASGRWSFTNPPIQQFPSNLRDILIPDPGHMWVRWDWDQAELRILAAMAGSRYLLDCFARGWDIHTLTVCECFNLPYPPQRVDPVHAPENVEWRQEFGWRQCNHAGGVCGKDDPRRVFAKRFRYRLCYGGNPRRSMDIPGVHELGLNADRLNRAALRMKAADPDLTSWWQETAETARRTRLSRTFLGRPCRLLGPPDKIVRQAFDHPMQGGVADIANRVIAQIAAERPDMEFVEQTHDSQTWQTVDGPPEVAIAGLRPYAEQVWDINGYPISLPASFKVVRLSAPGGRGEGGGRADGTPQNTGMGH